MTVSPYVIPYAWRNVAATVVLAVVLWGVPFILWPRAELAPERAKGRAMMKIKFLGVVQGVDGSAWSPVVFPLPTKYGFSERVDASGVGHDLSPVFRPGVPAGVFLELPALVTPPAEVGEFEGARGDSGFRPAGVRRPVFGGVRVADMDPWRIEMDESLRGRDYVVADLKAIMPEAGQCGGMEAYVELDRGGAPLHVLLEGSSGNTNLDRTIVRALYAGRGQRGSEGVGGRVRLFYWRVATEGIGQGVQ